MPTETPRAILKKDSWTALRWTAVLVIFTGFTVLVIPQILTPRKRSRATQVLEDLRQIDSAVDQYAIEGNKKSTDAVAWADIAAYVKTGTRLHGTGKDLFGNGVGADAVTREVVWEIAPDDFWSPFKP